GQMKGTNQVLTLKSIANYLVKKSVWIIGGDGWAYDIGFGGLDHVLASGKNVNMLVLDTEVYSNTGGQMSKATPRASVAKFASGGKPLPKKDLGLMMMSYRNIYVAQVAYGASQNQTIKAMVEAEKYNGPSLVISYSHCIAHGIDMSLGLSEEEKAVKCGHWLLYRFNPDLIDQGKNPLQIDSKAPSISYKDYAYSENRFRLLLTKDPTKAGILINQGQADCDRRWKLYSQMGKMDYSINNQE
ncbi:MAG: thiamine pyrophosphate-dependent enzyme, partial [Candidatus Zixiibacteriota bacterium]